jgi:hypothetical protein
VTRLFALLNKGRGVLEDAIPAPNAGCMTSSGAATVTTPIRRAGCSDGERAYSRPKVASRRAAKVIPIE